jgi:hypothetical protein
MALSREEYITPVGFAREPAKERRRWIGRFLLALLVAGLLFILFNRVISPPSTESPAPATQSSLANV